jgi:hypothetical protein
VSNGLTNVIAPAQPRKRPATDLNGCERPGVTPIWHPRAWIVPVSMGLVLAAFGGWGIADRELAERSGETRGRSLGGLRLVRGLAVLVGALGTIVACFAVLGLALGTWIS